MLPLNALRLATLAALAVAAGVASAAAQTVVAGPTTTDVTATAGERFTLPIAVDMTGAGGAKLGAYRLSLRWKPSLLSFVSISGGAFGAPTTFTDSTGQGLLRLAAANANGGTGLLTIANVTFEVASTAAADTFKLAFQELNAAATFADLLPGLSVTSGVFCGGPVWGDVDNSGTVQALDAQIVLMHAVGLAVTGDTTRGDVDADTKVNPRDALVILSKVVGLDVSAFRVGQFMVSACLGGAPATLAVVPSPLALTAGDAFAARAEVRDAGGSLLVGKNLAWSSDDAAVATVDSTGQVTAVANGSATITAAVAPGITGTASVTVGDRHRWVVNPTAAQGKPSEVGSDAYPFSTIKQAIDRAAVGDTVAVGVATYTEPLSSTKRLVFLGDSGAAGMPVIVRGDAPAGVLDVAGLQVVRRVAVASSRAGLLIRADSADLSSIVANSSGGPALAVMHAQRTRIRGITVSTAGGAGIWVDSAVGAVVSITGARIAGVGSLPVPLLTGSDYGVHAAGILALADSVDIDSATVAGVTIGEMDDGNAMVVGIFTSNTGRTRVRHASVTDVGWQVGPYDGMGEGGWALGIAADSVGTLEVRDSVSVARVAGSGIAMRGDTLRVVAGVRVVDVWDAAISADSGYGRLEVSDVLTGRAPVGVEGRFGGTATIRRSEFDNSFWSGVMTGADTTAIDSVIVQVADQSGWGCGVLVDSNAAVTTIDHARIVHAGYGLGVCSRDPVTTGDPDIQPVGYVAITNSAIDGAYTAVHVHADSLLLQQDSIRAWSWGVWLEGGAPRQTAWVKLRQVAARGLFSQGLFADSALAVEVVGSAFDSTNTECLGYYSCSDTTGGIEIRRAGSVVVDSNSVTRGWGSGVSLTGVATAEVRGNVITGHQFGTFEAAGLLVRDVSSSLKVVGNAFTGNAIAGVRLGDALVTAVIDTNLIADDSASGMVLSSSLTGAISGSYNSIRRNAWYGLLDSSSVAGQSFVANNFEGNRFGLSNLGESLVDASDSWWGDPAGPSCDTVCASGDSVSANVKFAPVATDTVPSTPLGAPRFAGATTLLRGAPAAPAVVGRARMAAPVARPAGASVRPGGGGGGGESDAAQARVVVRAPRGPFSGKERRQ
jgi:hypothetical protein